MNIYLSPSEAIEAAERAYAFHLDSQTATLSAAREAAYRALIQYIVKNPRELSDKEMAQMSAPMLTIPGHANAWNESFRIALRLAFTPPTPDVPEKIVAICEKHFGRMGTQDISPDAARSAVIEAYEAGMAQSKGGAA